MNLDPGVKIGSLSIQGGVPDGVRATVTAFKNLADGDVKARPQAVILVDDSSSLSGGARRRTLEQVKEAVRDLVGAIPPKSQVALLFYDDDVRTAVTFDAATSRIAAEVDNLRFAGDTTRTFAALSEAIDALSKREGLSKNIYLFTDGVAEDDGSQEAVIAAAKAANVSISTYIAHWLPRGRPQRGQIATMFEFAATSTGGAMVESDVEDRPDFTRDLSRLVKDQAEAGGVVRLKNATQTTTVNVELISSRAGERRGITPIAGTIEFPKPEAPKAEPKPAPEPKIWEQAWFIPAAAGAIVLVLLLLFLLLRKRRSDDDGGVIDPDDTGDEGASPDPNPEDEFEDDGVTRRVDGGGDGPVLARLIMTIDGSELPITSSRFTIGRAPNNGVVLRDDSISRDHCAVHQTREGEFAITDLDSLNKTFVNDAIVKTRTLQDGDRVKLGDVEFEFKLGAG